MRTLLLLLLCIPAYAAPLPPMPTVTRPAPLLSPRHASAPKSTPMVRFTVAAGESTLSTLAPFWMSHTLDQIFFDGLVDITHVQSIQRANKGNRFEFKDSSAPGGWSVMVDWAPYPEEQVAIVEVYPPTDQRVQARFFRVVEYTTPALLSESGNWVLAGSKPLYRTNPALKIRTWRTKR